MNHNSNLKEFFNISLILTRTQLKSRYRSTFAGAIWVIINPIILFLAHALIFKQIIKLDIPNYFIFLLASLIPWTFIVGNINMVIPSLVTNREFLNSFNINPLSLVVSTVLDNFLNFCISFLIIGIGVFLLLETSFTTSIFLLPFAIINLLLFNMGISIFLSTVHVFFRDTQYFINFVNGLMYLLTPIFYPVEMVPSWAKVFVEINPYYIMIRPFQLILNNFSNTSLVQPFLIATILGVGSFIFGFLFWQKMKDEIYAVL
ncbi:ABC transporter permease [Halobacteriovorax sp. JY17]|uniref:ABC transporter permease n=1 Tax=Halobacteriovorax sp. JY17 TaxID=2014617 RepID=UPI000C457D16|nr:ABC transporter permease [Halobacteriovorax sp. JY17]PIK14028.1 MAG: hypothetical protein CES88_13675 [Halobacteriovorax sp. JY17]